MIGRKMMPSHIHWL